MKRTLFALILVFFASPSLSDELTITEISSIKVSLIELCRAGTKEGSYKNHEIKGNGDIKLFTIKNLVNAGIGGSIEFKKGEWDGIKALVPDPGKTSGFYSAYQKCIDSNTPIFMNALAAARKKEGNEVRADDCNNITIGGNSTGNTILCK